jgi:hypothetical protein
MNNIFEINNDKRISTKQVKGCIFPLKYKTNKLLFIIFVLFSFNLQGQKIEAVNLSDMDLLEANNCYVQILPRYAFLTTTREYLAPNYEYSLTEIEKYYDLETKTEYKYGDTILNSIHLAEYQISYDTITVRKPNNFKTIEIIRGDTIFEYFEITPSDTLLMQCSKCNDLNVDNLFNAFCKIIKPAKLTLNKKYLKKINQIISEDTFPKIIINTNYEMIKPPYAEYEYQPPRVIATRVVATPKTDEVPKYLVQKKKYVTTRQAKPYACFSGWTWKYFICSSCKPEHAIYNNGKILELQKRLQELNYPVKLTNIINYEFIQLLKDMDLKALKNDELIGCATRLIKNFKDDKLRKKI